ncbi:TPA: hypothetical protein EYP26_03700 [Candidatus Bathyarchaeota archaeon]|nr:hypothetical protein [Candidatus Bathyarchaeota archaeon]
MDEIRERAGKLSTEELVKWRKEGAKGPKVIVNASVAAKRVVPGEPWDAEAEALKGWIARREVEAYTSTFPLRGGLHSTKSHVNPYSKTTRRFRGPKGYEGLCINIQATSWSFPEILEIYCR